MRPPRLASIVALLAVAACGGSVARTGSSDGGNPINPVGTCPSAASVVVGGSCPVPQQQCTGTVEVPTCGTGTSTTTVQCTCDDGSWSCPVEFAEPPCPTNVVCPTPQSISPLGACALPSTLSCTSGIPVLDCDGVTVDGYELCNCVSDQWQCAQGAPTCPIDAGDGACPSGSIFAGDGCSTASGVVCSGDPQICGNTTVYDALQCTGGVWQVVAATFCDVDGGGPEAGAQAGSGI